MADSFICPKCGASAYVNDSAPATAESIQEDIDHCLLCGFSQEIERPPRYPREDMEPMRHGRPAGKRDSGPRKPRSPDPNVTAALRRWKKS